MEPKERNKMLRLRRLSISAGKEWIVAALKISERVRHRLAIKKSRCYVAFLAAATSRLRSATVLFVAITLATVAAFAAAPAATATSTQTASASQTLRGSARATSADPYEECLTNDSPECVSLTGTEIAIIASTVAGVATNLISGAGKVAIVYLVKKFLGWWDGPGSHTPTRLWSGYYEDGGDSGGAGANTNLCLSGLGEDITFQPCGANGTVWIEEPDNNGGNYNFTRYAVDNDGCVINSPGSSSSISCDVMTAGPLTNGSALYTWPPVGSGTPYWQDWNP